MAALSAVLEVQNANGERVDLALRQPGGGYLPVNLVIGAGLSATAARNGPVVEVTIAADAGAGVTAVTAGAPLTSSGGTTPNITIATADGSNRGAMPAAHWTLINGATPNPTADRLAQRGAGGEVLGAFFSTATSAVASTGTLRAPSGAHVVIASKSVNDVGGTIPDRALFVVQGNDDLAIGTDAAGPRSVQIQTLGGCGLKLRGTGATGGAYADVTAPLGIQEFMGGVGVNTYRHASGASTPAAPSFGVEDMGAGGGSEILVTSHGHALNTGQLVFIAGATGTTEGNGLWSIAVDDADGFTLDGSTFANAYLGGATINCATLVLTVPVPDNSIRYLTVHGSAWDAGAPGDPASAYVFKQEAALSVLASALAVDVGGGPASLTDTLGVAAADGGLYFDWTAGVLSVYVLGTLVEVDWRVRVEVV